MKRLYENLPVCMMRTLSRMYSSEGFFPNININELFHLTTVERYSLEDVNPVVFKGVCF